MNKQNPKNYNKINSTGNALVTALITIALVVFIPLGIIGGLGLKCKVGQNNVKNDHKAAISQFEKMKLTSSDNVTPRVYLGGDCFDSSPYVQVDKTVPSVKPAPELLTDMRATLTSEGYALSNEKVDHGSCGYGYSAKAKGNDIEAVISFVTYSDDGSSVNGCSTGRAVPENELQGKNAKAIVAQLKT